MAKTGLYCRFLPDILGIASDLHYIDSNRRDMGRNPSGFTMNGAIYEPEL